MHITPTEYANAMRRLETMRNEALGRGDRSALAAIALRETDLNRVFFGRDPGGRSRQAFRRPAA